MNTSAQKGFFGDLYCNFSRPLSQIDCGDKCGPFNEYGVPVCCDINLIIPSAYEAEWDYLKEMTDLWFPWSSAGPLDSDLEDEKQDGQVLLKCLGYQHCQRPYRTLTCRAFPFFPYLDSREVFIGLVYFHEYREMCWIISNLSVVSAEYKAEFQNAFEALFQEYPQSKVSYAQYSAYIRQEMAVSGDEIFLLDFTENIYIVDPESELYRQVDFEDLEAYGPFSITKDLIFPDENPK
jgi:hypothetical protein